MAPEIAVPLAIIAGYAVGSIPFGHIAGRMNGVDLRTVGSKNIGATNAGRVLGFRWFLIVFLCDMAKGLVPALAVGWVGTSLLNQSVAADLRLWCGIGALIGHSFPVWLGFKGGKAVATGLGVMLALNPVAAACAFGLFALVLATTRYMSLASITASAMAPVFFWLHSVYTDSDPFQSPLLGRWIFFALAGLFIVYRHRSNIGRLINRTEPKIGKRVTAAPSAGGPA